MRQISEKKKIQEKEAEEVRDNKGAEKTEQNGLNEQKKEEKINQTVVCTIYHICAREKHPQETQEKDQKDYKTQKCWKSTESFLNQKALIVNGYHYQKIARKQSICYQVPFWV